jgi:hypothetical protein
MFPFPVYDLEQPVKPWSVHLERGAEGAKAAFGHDEV